MKHRIYCSILFLTVTIGASAQSEGGLLLGVAAEKKVSQKLSVDLEAGFRTRNDFKTADRWSVAVGAEYKLTRWLKADAGYALLNNNFREKLTDYVTDKGNARVKWRPSYWALRHRLHASLAADYKLWGNLRLSLREQWQYTYRPEKSVTRWKLNPTASTMKLDDDYVRGGKAKHKLRSRLQVQWDKKRALIKPYGSAELYNCWNVEKVRYTLGTDIRLSKQHSLDVYYRYQDMINVDDDDYDPDMHYIGIGYKMKF